MQDVGKTILVVDDEEVVRDLVSNFLGKLGYDVVQATDGTEALVAFDQMKRPPAVLVTDIVMPKLGGVQLSQILRERNPDLCVLFVSSYPDKKLGDAEMANPHSSYLAKPFSLRNFASAISNLAQVGSGTESAQ
jgi:two-component system cell cycle sensor histidine kinase/response regulator CckA